MSLGVGLGLRPAHYQEALGASPPVRWFEVITENFLGLEGGTEGPPLRWLERFRKDFPIALHGVSLSIGSTDSINTSYLKKLKALADRINPWVVSDHISWSGAGGINLHDLLPLPYTEASLAHVVSRVQLVQEFLGRQIALENVSSYLSYSYSEMPEWEFVTQIAKRSGCKLLLDINNVFVSANNQDFDPWRYLSSIPVERVAQFHLGGPSETENGFLIDTHDHPVPEAVWELYRRCLGRFGDVPTLVEWDSKLPSFARLTGEAIRAEQEREALWTLVRSIHPH